MLKRGVKGERRKLELGPLAIGLLTTLLLLPMCRDANHEFGHGEDAGAGGTPLVSAGAPSVAGDTAPSGGTDGQITSQAGAGADGDGAGSGVGGDGAGGNGAAGAPQTCGDTLCSGECVDTSSDPKHCGQCDHDCLGAPHLAANATATCAKGKCVLGPTPCAAAYGNCNDEPDDGCEQPLDSVDSCRACTTKCSATQVCDVGGCVNTCAQGKLCGTSCIDVSNAADHCGDCSKVCPAPLTSAASGSAKCSGGACGIECKTGYKLCGSSCVASCGSNSICSGETCTCPANAPVLSDGLCCPTGQQNCGGVCVACAAGSVCSGTTCACPSTGQCVNSVPNGWLGPVAADLSGQNAACPVAYPTSIATGTNPQGAAATCNCACGTCAGGTCSVSLEQFSGGADCGTVAPSDSHVIGTTVNSCDGATPNGSLYWIKGAATKPGATCSLVNNGFTAPTASWGTQTRLCTGATTTPGACNGGQLCAPSVPTPKKTCIYKSGANTCPAGYPAASTQYSSFSDDRGCSCSCDVNTITCSPEADYIDTTSGCNGAASFSVTSGQCSSVFAGSTHGFKITKLNLAPIGKLTATPTGSVTAATASALTVCCTN